MKKKQSKLFYGWYIVLSGFIMLIFGICIVFNCTGLFIKPVTADLGFSRGAFSLNITLVSMTGILVAVSIGWLFRHFPIQNVIRFASVALPISYFFYSRAQSLLSFYIISAFVGIFVGLCGFVPIAILISNWFREKRGIATGLAFTGSGVGGMLLSPIIAKLIESFGWRFTYAALAVAMLVIVTPFTFFVIKAYPKDKGLAPFGERTEKLQEEKMETGLTLKNASQTTLFWTLLFVVVCSTAGVSSLIQQLSAYASDIGFSVTVSANLIAAFLGGLAVGKVLLGWLYDKFGVPVASIIALGCLLFSFVLLLFAENFLAMILALFFASLGAAFTSVAYPILTRGFFGQLDYNSIYGVVSAAGGVGTAIGSPLSAAIFDFSGSYKGAWTLWSALFLICICLFMWMNRAHKRHMSERAF